MALKMVKIFAYPEAALQCNPGALKLENLTNYNNVEFFGTYLLSLMNEESPVKETVFQCTATNSAGMRTLNITLTAKAPKPEITSSPTTQWYNSYQLKWQHDVKANIDYYHVEIQYKGDNNSVRLEEFKPHSQLGAMALVNQDDAASIGKRLHTGVVFNLRPDSEHEIRLRSCNQHGCSEFSDPVKVQTKKESAQAFNDPANPTKALNEPTSTSTKTLHSTALLIWIVLGGATLGHNLAIFI